MDHEVRPWNGKDHLHGPWCTPALRRTNLGSCEGLIIDLILMVERNEVHSIHFLPF